MDGEHLGLGMMGEDRGPCLGRLQLRQRSSAAPWRGRPGGSGACRWSRARDGLRILLAEDDCSIVRIASAMLEKYSHSLVHAG